MNLSLQHSHYRERIVHSLAVAVAHYFKNKSPPDQMMFYLQVATVATPPQPSLIALGEGYIKVAIPT